MTSVIAPVWQELYVAALRNGDLPATAAAFVGATQKQVNFWRTQSEEFNDACTQILEERVDALESRAYNLALTSTYEPVYSKGELIGEKEVIHKDLLMFMLKSSRDKFNDKLITQSKVDHNITISINSFATSPDNAREVIEGEYTGHQHNIRATLDTNPASHRPGDPGAVEIESFAAAYT